MPRKNKTPHVRRISPGTRMFLLTIYLPWLLSMIPYSYWASTCSADLPSYSAFMVSVRQASDLPPASFRFPVTQDTLALGYILPAVGRIRDFHPLKHAPAGRTSSRPGQIIIGLPGRLFSRLTPFQSELDIRSHFSVRTARLTVLSEVPRIPAIAADVTSGFLAISAKALSSSFLRPFFTMSLQGREGN